MSRAQLIWGIPKEKEVAVKTDTDVDGGAAGIIAYASLKMAGYRPRIYAHYAERDSKQPGTYAAQYRMKDVLQYLGGNYGAIITIDIPPATELQRRAENLDTIRQVTTAGATVIIYDQYDHAEPEYWQQLRDVGAITRLYWDGMSVKLGLAVDLGVYDPVFERFALLGSVADNDQNVSAMTSREFEEFVQRVVDAVHKFVMPQYLREQGISIEQFGSTGAEVYYVVERLNLDYDRYLQLIRELEPRIPPNQRLPPAPLHYRSLQYVVVADAEQNRIAPGLMWKFAWLLTYTTGAPVAVVYGPSPRGGYTILIAAYWRRKHEVAPIIEELARDLASRIPDSLITGHYGARSVGSARMTKETAEQLALEVARRLNEAYETRVLGITSQASRVLLGIGVGALEEFAKAINADLRAILDRIAAIEERQLQLYQEYLELKRRQVELLERMGQQGQGNQQRFRAD